MIHSDAHAIVDNERANRWARVACAKFTSTNRSPAGRAEVGAQRAPVLGIYDPDVESEARRTLARVPEAHAREVREHALPADEPALPGQRQAVGRRALAGAEPRRRRIWISCSQRSTRGARPSSREPTDEEIEEAIRARVRSAPTRLEREIQDQLRELGGNRTLDYVALCRKVLMSGIQYGMGILKGPFIDRAEAAALEAQREGQLVLESGACERPRFEFVPIWDYYPDMAAKTFAQMDGQFTRVVMSRHQVIQLKRRPDFIEKQIDEALMRRSRAATTSAARSRPRCGDGSAAERDRGGARQVRGDRVGGQRHGRICARPAPHLGFAS
jgi:hypothetical protein